MIKTAKKTAKTAKKTPTKSAKPSGKPTGKPRGRPRLGEEARQSLIDVTGALLATDGLEKLNARAIAARSGVAVGTIYKYFEDLDELVRYANGKTYDDLFAFQTKVVQEAAAKGGGVYEQLMALAEGYLDFVQANQNRWAANLTFNSKQETPPDWYRAKEGALLGVVEGVMRGIPDLGDQMARLQIAMALWSSVHGIITITISGGFAANGSQEAMEQIAIIVEPVVRKLEG